MPLAVVVDRLTTTPEVQTLMGPQDDVDTTQGDNQTPVRVVLEREQRHQYTGSHLGPMMVASSTLSLRTTRMCTEPMAPLPR